MNILKSIIEKLLPQALNFNCIMDTGDYPDEWLLEVIKTIYKNKGVQEQCRKLHTSDFIIMFKLTAYTNFIIYIYIYCHLGLLNVMSSWLLPDL